MAYSPTRKITVFALDPCIRSKGARGDILRMQIEIPNEYLEAGPRGYRAAIVDYDSSANTFHLQSVKADRTGPSGDAPPDPFAKKRDAELLASRDFHNFMAFGIVMKTLSRFEFALGRRLSWSFKSHQIQVAPHAFCDANAFYSDRAQGLFFGYFPSNDRKRTIYTCLSHEIVAHETTHALLDGLRERYTDPSSPQQAGFHEGFADIVAFLSVLSAQSIVERVVDRGLPKGRGGSIRRESVRADTLRESGLFGLAEEMGSELAGIHGEALRRSITLKPREDYFSSGEYDEAHACGEILVAAVLNAYLLIWVERLRALGNEKALDRPRAAEEGAELADHLLNVCIRAIDYCPPTDIEFRDFASALLTVDAELNPSDAKYHLRDHLRKAFKSYGIRPASPGKPGRQPGSWDPPPPEEPEFKYDRTHFENMKSDPDELFRFLWENQSNFKLHDQAFTRVLSVRPCTRIGRDGFILRETVAEYHQQLKLFAKELSSVGIAKPAEMPDDTEITLYGGNAVIFDEYGHVKYNIGKSIMDKRRQSDRLNYLWKQGAFGPGASKDRAFSRLHMRRNNDWYTAVTDNSLTDAQE